MIRKTTANAYDRFRDRMMFPIRDRAGAPSPSAGA